MLFYLFIYFIIVDVEHITNNTKPNPNLKQCGHPSLYVVPQVKAPCVFITS